MSYLWTSLFAFEFKQKSEINSFPLFKMVRKKYQKILKSAAYKQRILVCKYVLMIN